MLAKLKKSSFVKNVAMLLSGTAISQGIVLAAAPILTRIYDPQVFGTFALFTSVLAILAVFASWKYEMATVLAKNDREAANIIYLAAFILLINVILISLIIFIFGNKIVNALGTPELYNYLWWVPICVLGTGLYQIFNYWTIRYKEYKRLASSRITKSTSEVLSQITIGKLIGSSSGLVVGYVIGRVLSAITLGKFIWKNDRAKFSTPELDIIKKQISEYKDFPLYNTPQHFLNALSTNITPFMLAYFFSPEVVGFYAISVRVLTMPVELISKSVGQVYYQKATEIYSRGISLFDNLKKTTFGLFSIAIIPWLVFIVFAPKIFSLLLGDNWFEAGQYAQWVAIWMFFVYLNAPAVKSLIVLSLQKIQFYINIVFFSLRIIALVYGGTFLSPLNTIILYVIVSVISNLTIILVSFYCTYKKNISKQFN